MDEVFRAIDDPSRRLLLDRLFEDDGQTLGDLCNHLPGMTRFGVMNHLRVLEQAGLVVTTKRGRSKHHYLNPVPIRLVHDRWIGKYTEARVGAIAGLKAHIERGMRPVDKPMHIYQTYIRASIGEVWDAITDPDQTMQYFYGTRVASDWQVGSAMDYSYTDGRAASTGHILAIDPPNRMEFTFKPLWDEDMAAEGEVREIWSLREVNGMVELTVELYDIGPRTLEDFAGGLPYILSGLKSLVETGQALPPPYVAAS